MIIITKYISIITKKMGRCNRQRPDRKRKNEEAVLFLCEEVGRIDRLAVTGDTEMDMVADGAFH